MIVSEVEWRALAADHARRTDQWIQPHLDRRRRGHTHPVMDFLFDYYPYSPGRLGTWHPGLRVRLEGDWEPSSNAHAYTHDGTTWGVDPLTVDRARLALALGILKGTNGRAAQHSCFGMHEWAMVYRTSPSDVRHESESLRLSPTEITEVVDSVGLRCTHIDAFRFFTAEAEPLNEHTPTRAGQANDEQPGCIHANMDLNTC